MNEPTVKVNGAPVEITDSAKEAIRLNFNPSGVDQVSTLKTLAAAFISECTRISPEAGREAAVAITNMQTASMWAVLGATKGK